MCGMNGKDETPLCRFFGPCSITSADRKARGGESIDTIDVWVSSVHFVASALRTPLVYRLRQISAFFLGFTKSRLLPIDNGVCKTLANSAPRTVEHKTLGQTAR